MTVEAKMTTGPSVQRLATTTPILRLVTEVATPQRKGEGVIRIVSTYRYTFAWLISCGLAEIVVGVFAR